MSSLRSKLVTVAAVGAAAVGGAAVANAASSSQSSTSSPSASPPSGAMVNGRHSLNGRTEQPLTGGVAAKVRAAALAKVAGSVERVETNVDDSAPYEAHIRKADGTEVTVEINRDYTVHAVNTMGSGHHP